MVSLMELAERISKLTAVIAEKSGNAELLPTFSSTGPLDYEDGIESVSRSRVMLIQSLRDALLLAIGPAEFAHWQ